MCSECLREIVLGPEILGFQEYGKPEVFSSYMELGTLREDTNLFRFQSLTSYILNFMES
jgi:hypothetical protein